MKPAFRIFVALCMACPVAAMAAPAGSFDTVTGNVTVTMPGKPPVKVAPGEMFDSGARIQSGPGSSASLKFSDGEQVSLKQNTDFSVTNYSFDAAKPAQGSALFTFVRGGMRFITGLIGKSNPSQFAVKLPTVTAGVRGTTFEFQSSGDGNSEFVTCTDGAIVLTDSQGRTQDVAAGQFALVTAAGIRFFPSLAAVQAANDVPAEFKDFAAASSGLNTGGPASPTGTAQTGTGSAGFSGGGGGTISGTR